MCARVRKEKKNSGNFSKNSGNIPKNLLKTIYVIFIIIICITVNYPHKPFSCVIILFYAFPDKYTCIFVNIAYIYLSFICVLIYTIQLNFAATKTGERQKKKIAILK